MRIPSPTSAPTLALIAALTLLTGACGEPQPDVTVNAGDPDAATIAVPSDESGAQTAPAGTAKAPPAFGICRSCHSIEKGRTLIGPSLAGVYGTRAGAVAGYDFSPALKSSGLVWNDATLDKWLTDPVALVPGTRMGYAGQADPARRAAIIAYLKTLQ